MKRIFLFLILLGFSVLCYAAPREIIIIRHSDKLLTPPPGPALAPTGYARAVKFAFYYLKHYPTPDYVFAVNPIRSKIARMNSIHEIQTLLPIVNILTSREKKPVYILHPYNAMQYPLLAKALLNDPKYNNKVILVCWDHFNIPFFAKDLGLKAKLPKWPKHDFDNVLVLHFDKQGKISRYQYLTNQYPVHHHTWEEIYQKID